jgi:anti-sigma-K factor RskA
VTWRAVIRTTVSAAVAIAMASRVDQGFGGDPSVQPVGTPA